MKKQNIIKFFLLMILFTSFIFVKHNRSDIVSKNVIVLENYNRYTTDDILTDKLNGSIDLKLAFIGFDQTYIDESNIESQLQNDFSRSFSLPLEEVHINYEFEHVSELERAALESYILNDASTNGTDTGYELNVTRLMENMSTGDRTGAFLPRDGRSINASLVNEYLYSNLYEPAPPGTPGYTLFIMNFSQFDTTDHSLEHWYDVTNNDLDSEEQVSWWYSGYTGIEKRAAMGWGGKYRFSYIDLSSRSWYLDYVYNAWTSLGGTGYQLYYQYPDLDNFTQVFDLDTIEGQGNFTQYLAEWINSYAGNVFSRPTYPDMPTGQSISLQVLVFNNLTDNGYAEEDINWCISEMKIYSQLKADLPWIDWDINVTWVFLSDYPDYYNYIQNNYAVDVNGKYLEVSAGFFSILENDLDIHFNLSKADVVLPCYFFLTNEVSFKWGGVSFAGLGGMGWEILLGTQNSIFENGDINLKKRGMSDVMIHELGHSMGLPHPHCFTHGWGSSFVDDTMSYFALSHGFSSFYIDAIATGHTEANYYYAQDEYEIALQSYADSNVSSTELTNMMIEINATLAAIPTHYNNMDYTNSASLAFYARSLIADMVDYLQNPPSTSPDTWQDWWTGLIIEGSVLIFSVVIIIAVFVIRKR